MAERGSMHGLRIPALVLIMALAVVLTAALASAQSYDRSAVVDRTPQELAAVAGPLVPRALTQATTNGGFEDNGGVGSSAFTGWTVVNLLSATGAPGAGDWYVQTGTATAVNGFTVAAPPEGVFAAMTDQTGPGSHILYQDIAIPANVTSVTLMFDLFLMNQAGDYVDLGSLIWDGDPNQQFRADIMDPSAAVDDVGAGVLLNVYQTQAGDPLTSGYTTITADLTQFAGQTVRIRFAEVDNQLFLAAGVDNVVLDVELAPIPTLSWLGLLALIFSVLGAGIFILRRALA